MIKKFSAFCLAALAMVWTPSIALAAGPFDGSYIGSTINMTGGKGTQGCLNANNKTIVVKDSVLDYTSTSTSTHEVFHDKIPVGADGNFKGTAGLGGQMSGQFTATGMTGQWSVLACQFKMEFKKS